MKIGNKKGKERKGKEWKELLVSLSPSRSIVLLSFVSSHLLV